jgi:hypothetical protein
MGPPPDGSLIQFTKGFYRDRMYLVVNGGQLQTLSGETVFWEFFRDGKHLGPLGEAKWRDDCERLEVAWEIKTSGPFSP